MVTYGTGKLRDRSQAYALLALAVREQWEMETLPELRRESGGKPYFAGGEGRQFNLSHSGSLALCVLDERPVGADIQVVKRWREGLPGRVCSPKELAWLEGQADRWGSFTQLWTMKECWAKYTGGGLRQRISGIRVPIPRPGESLYQQGGLWFRLYTGQGWRGAVCGLVPPPEKICWRDGPWENSPFTSGENPAIITERQ